VLLRAVVICSTVALAALQSTCCNCNSASGATLHISERARGVVSLSLLTACNTVCVVFLSLLYVTATSKQHTTSTWLLR
jgi:hypothetical protein